MDKYIVFDFPCGMQKRMNFGAQVRGMKYNGQRPSIATVHGITAATITSDEAKYVVHNVYPALDARGGLVGYAEVTPKEPKIYSMKDYV